LQFGILPPLIIDVGLRLATGIRPARRSSDGVGGRRGARASSGWVSMGPAPGMDGIQLGGLVAAQVFLTAESALLVPPAGVLRVLGLAAASPAAILRRLRPVGAGLVVAGAVAFGLDGHGLWTQFSGPLPQHGPLFPPDFYVNDLSGFVNPSGYLAFHTAGT